MAKRKFAETASAENRRLPSNVYEPQRGGYKESSITLKDVKKEVKSLIDLMDKRFKSAIRKGVEYERVKQYERENWKPVSMIKDIKQGVYQIRQMWKVIKGLGSAGEQHKKQMQEYEKAYETLLQHLHFEKGQFTFKDFIKFQSFWNLYSRANEEASYYKVLKSFVELTDDPMDEQQTFRKASLEDVLDHWKEWQERADELEAQEEQRYNAGKFVNYQDIKADIAADKKRRKSRFGKNPKH